MASDRPFYGGDAVGHTQGEISGGVYRGPKPYPERYLWKCPACKADQAGPFEDGCTACGSGAVKARHVDGPVRSKVLDVEVPPESNLSRQQRHLTDSPAFTAVRSDMRQALDVYQYALTWSGANPDATLADAFVAGYQYANQKTIGAPPVSVDVPQLAVEGKAKRTIAAALEHFKEHVLPRAVEEIASGEFCSLEEIDQLIQQFSEGEEQP